MPYTCLVCGYPNLPAPPSDYEICPSCGTEFEYHDARKTHEALRLEWIGNGMHWYSQVVHQPADWSPIKQLIDAGYLPIRTQSTILGTSTQEYDIKPQPLRLHFTKAYQYA